MPIAIQRDWLTLSEVCEVLECSATPIKTLVIKGQLTRREHQSNRKYSAADVQRILGERKEAPHE